MLDKDIKICRWGVRDKDRFYYGWLMRSVYHLVPKPASEKTLPVWSQNILSQFSHASPSAAMVGRDCVRAVSGKP